MFSRRACLVASWGSFAARPGQAQPRPTGVARVGVLWHAGSAEQEGKYLRALIDGFRDFGYVEGQNIYFEHRFPNEEPARFQSCARELVALKPDLIVTISVAAALAVKASGTTVPWIFLVVGDPVGKGLVSSLAAPGANVTGFSMDAGTEIAGKRLQLLQRTVADLGSVAVLFNRSAPASESRYLADYQVAAKNLGVRCFELGVSSPAEFEEAVSVAVREGANGLVIGGGPLFFVGAGRLAQLANARRLPTMHYSGEAVDAGCLMSFGTNLERLVRRGASYGDRILKGQSPATLPVQLPVDFELCLNLVTAKMIGLRVPAEILLLADRTVR